MPPYDRWFVARQTDRAGNVSGYGESKSIKVDTIAPGTVESASLDLSTDPPRLYVGIAGATSVLLFEGANLVGKAGDLLDVSALTTGQHVLSAKGVDDANPDGPLVPVLLITRGTSGDDNLVGTAGLDLLSGGAGNDQYTIDETNDGVTEGENEGYDLIVTGVSYALGSASHVETLAAKPGAGNLTLTGNDFANTIEGGDGDDTLVGAAGDDTLRGGAGRNIAVFPANLSEYVISPGLAGATTVIRAGETDTLIDIQTLQFTDANLAAAVDGPWWYAIKADFTSMSEGTGAATQATFTVDRIGDTSLASAVAWATCTCAIPDTYQPVDGADFTGGKMPSGSLEFAAGESSRTITIEIAGDSQLESNEAYRVKLLASLDGVPLVNASVTQSIINDDAQLSTNSYSTTISTEGTGGSTSFTYYISRTGSLRTSPTVQWSISGIAGSGTLPADAQDFVGGTLPSGTISFAAWQSEQAITVKVAADSVGEMNERFRLALSNPSAGATIDIATADALILNDDTSIGVAATTPIQAEGHTGTRTYSFVVQRNGTTTGTNDVSWSIAGAGPTPATASDFTGSILPAGVLSFSPGQTSQKITIAVNGDNTIEPDEQFQLTLAAPTNGATLHQPTATATILNDDATLSIAALSANKPEGTGAPTPFTFTITRTGDVSKTHTAKWSAAGTTGTNTQPADAKDFPGGVLPAGTVTFSPNETTKLLTVNIAADQTGELNERFAVTLTAPSPGATIGTATAGAVILNDDTSLAITPTGINRAEGNTGTNAFTYTVQRSGALSATTKVDWTFTPGGVGGTTPVNAADFTGATLPTGGTLTFAPSQTSQKIAVAIAADTAPELNESFTLTLSNPTAGVNITSAAAKAVILDDDTIYGTPGNNTLIGTPGRDLFVIGQGQDNITGGLGLDAFRFLPTALGPAAANTFTFEDFSSTAGEKLDLSRIDAIPGGPDNPFSFIGTAAFNGTPGQLRYTDTGPTRLIQANTNADLIPDLTIIVKAPGPLDASWFIL